MVKFGVADVVGSSAAAVALAKRGVVLYDIRPKPPRLKPHKGDRPANHPAYRRDIDGLRALAVISVIVFHAFPSLLKGGFIGVDIFFVISGFLISSILFNSLEAGQFSIADFYARRIRRIFPALLLMLVACLGFGWFLLIADEYQRLGKHIAAGAVFVSNFALWSESGYFDASANQKPLLHLWSLGIEEQFYVFWPILLCLAYRRHKSFLAVTLGIATVSFIVNLSLVTKHPVAAFYSPLSRFWELMIGGLLAYITTHKPQYLSTRGSSIWSLLGLLMICIALFVIRVDGSFPGWWALLPTVGTFLIIFGGTDVWLNRVVLSNRLLVFVGLISYPLYLWHWPILYFAGSISTLPSRITRLIAVLISILFAVVTYLFVEKPLRHKKFAKETTTYLAVGMATCASIGMVINALGGLSFRLPQQFVQFTRSAIDDSHTDCFLVSGSKFQPKCTALLRHPAILIWGDSHADRLYAGFRRMQDKGQISILQVTGASCPPLLKFRSNGNAGCEDINNYALETVRKMLPEIVLLHANWSADTVDLTKLDFTVTQLKEAGARNVVIMGPVPLWKGTILRSLFRCWHPTSSADLFPLYSTCGLNPQVPVVDIALKQLAVRLRIRYISAYAVLCNAAGCLTHADEDGDELTTYDYGHLSVAGAKYLVDAIGHELLSGGAPYAPIDAPLTGIDGLAPAHAENLQHYDF